MSFRDLARSLCAGALPILDDIPKECLVQHGSGEPFYDTTTGNVYEAPAAESQVSLIFSPVGSSNRGETEKRNAPVGDIEALALDVSQFRMRPATGDLVNVVNSDDKYSVVDVSTDELEATFTLILVRIGGGVSDDAVT